MNISAILILATVLCGLCACQSVPSTTAAPGDSSEVISVNGQLEVPSIETLWDQIQDFLPQNLIGDAIANSPVWNLIRLRLEDVYTQLQNMGALNARIIESFLNRIRNFIRVMVRRIREIMPKASIGVTMRRERRSILTSPIETLESAVGGVTNAVMTRAEAATIEMLEIAGNVITSTIIPWIHELLNRAAATGTLPPNVVSVIQALDTLYKLMHAMDLVG